MRIDKLFILSFLAVIFVAGTALCGWGPDVDISSDPINDQMHPAMAISENGVVYVAMEDDGIGTDTVISIYKSKSGGATWDYIATMQEPGADLADPDLAIGEVLGSYENYLFVAAVVRDGDDDFIRIGRYDIVNHIWIDFTDLTHNGNESHPKLVTDGRFDPFDWYVYLTYQIDRDASSNHDVYFRRSTNKGDTWSTTSPVFGNNDNDMFEEPAMAYGGGNLFIVCRNVDENSILLRRSIDFGATFKAVQTISSGTNEVSLPDVAAGPAGTGVIVYNRYYSTDDRDVFYSFTMNDGRDWSDVTYIPGAYTTSDELAPAIAASWIEGGDFFLTWTVDGDIMFTNADLEYPDTWMSTVYVNDSPNASNVYTCKGIEAHRFGASAIAWVDSRYNDVLFDGDFDNVPEVSVDVVIEYPMIERPGWLTYTPMVTNHLQSPKTIYFWNKVELPDGSIYPSSGYLFSYGPFTLDGYESFTAPRPVELRVPGAAPLGDYKLYSYVGTVLGGEPIDVSVEGFEVID